MYKPLRLIWALVTIVILIGIYKLVSTRNHHSEDQKILIEKAR